MTDLLEKKCIPCEGGIKAFDISEIHKYQKKVDGWEIIQNDKKVYLLEKKFKFKNVKNLSMKLEKSLRKRVIIQILSSDGVMPRLISQLML